MVTQQFIWHFYWCFCGEVFVGLLLLQATFGGCQICLGDTWMGIFEQMSFVRLKLVPIFWGNAAVCLSIMYRTCECEGPARSGSIGAKLAKYYVSISPQIFSCGTQLNIWPCMSVCLSVCLSVCPKFCPQFFFKSSRRSLRWMSLTKATYLVQQENKIYYGWLSWAVPHSDLNWVPQLMFEYRTCLGEILPILRNPKNP